MKRNRKRISLTLDKDLYTSLKRKTLNISRYVEKLLYKDLALKKGASNPGGPILKNFIIIRHNQQKRLLKFVLQ
ncbi:type II toxin-antitoxin system CcdA family antitoxin [Candidatus Woesearchaeota archaeon]|nr:type II toxin-antitoxin system CcdA family antitoxin [Candidatus Woesearchaeota archaeon]